MIFLVANAAFFAIAATVADRVFFAQARRERRAERRAAAALAERQAAAARRRAEFDRIVSEIEAAVGAVRV
jgi:hypothetical protein